MTTRLDRLLANLGYGSRREVQTLIGAGMVAFDGTVLRDAAAHVLAGSDLPKRMSIAGEPADPPFPFSLLLHKPIGLVCSHREPGRSVYELLPERWRRRTPALSTIGRLDLDTSGLMLLTDDGALLHRVISPRRHVTKTYLARLDRPMSGTEPALFASGTLVLEGDAKPLAPAQLELIEPTFARLTVTEGRYHQVRRMFTATGATVVALHRESIGALGLPADLAEGAWRIATNEDLAAIFREDRG